MMCFEARAIYMQTSNRHVVDEFIGVGTHDDKTRSTIKKIIFWELLLKPLLTPTEEERAEMTWRHKFVLKESQGRLPLCLGIQLDNRGCDELCTWAHNKIIDHPCRQSLINMFSETISAGKNLASKLKSLHSPTCEEDRKVCTNFLKKVLEEVTGLKCEQEKHIWTLLASPHIVAMCFNLRMDQCDTAARTSVDLFMAQRDLPVADRIFIETGIEIFHDVRRMIIQEDESV